GLSVLHAQLPATNLYAFDMKQVTDQVFEFSNPQFLTGFNKMGYNNQPNFISDDEIYLTVKSAETNEQTDIYSLNLRTRVRTRVTNTVESEYSPTRVPVGNEFSAVRVEADGQQTQRLWRFPMDRRSKGQPVFYNIKDVGYHYWLDRTNVALFIVGSPHKLVIANTASEQQTQIMPNIGRCFQQLPNGNMAFVHKIADGFWQIRELNTVTKRSEMVVTTLKDSEDFVVLSDGTFLMGSGSKLFKFNKAIDRDWVEIANFQSYGINNITRMAVNRSNKIVFVAN
ncbi:MAG: hypothetical protein AAFO94_03985, partial [Bacteroidota bacterium]